MDDLPTPKQRRLLQRLVAELESYHAFEAKGLGRRAAEVATRSQASDLIERAIKVLKEYQGG